MANDIIIYQKDGRFFASTDVLSWSYCGSGLTRLSALFNLTKQIAASCDFPELFRCRRIHIVK